MLADSTDICCIQNIIIEIFQQTRKNVLKCLIACVSADEEQFIFFKRLQVKL